MKDEDEKFLIIILIFHQNWNLIPHGKEPLFNRLDEVGVFMVGRGFEWSYRSIAKSRRS